MSIENIIKQAESEICDSRDDLWAIGHRATLGDSPIAEARASLDAWLAIDGDCGAPNWFIAGTIELLGAIDRVSEHLEKDATNLLNEATGMRPRCHVEVGGGGKVELVAKWTI